PDAIRSRSLVDQGCAAASAQSVRDKSARSRASSSAIHRPIAQCVCRWRAAAAPASVATKSSDPWVYLRELIGKVSTKTRMASSLKHTSTKSISKSRSAILFGGSLAASAALLSVHEIGNQATQSRIAWLPEEHNLMGIVVFWGNAFTLILRFFRHEVAENMFAEERTLDAFAHV